MLGSLSTYARINEFGFIESPYRRIKDDRATDFVQVINAGGSDLQVGDVVEISEAEKLNAATKVKKKKRVEYEPYSFCYRKALNA